MAIKDLYKEIESENSNNIKNTEMFSMPLDEYIDEHVKLIKVLREGSREELLAEAKDQEEELDQCLKDHGMTMADVQGPDDTGTEAD